MRGTLVRRTWEYNPAHYAPPRYRRACHYEAFIPEDLTNFAEPLAGELAGAVSDAESAIHQLNARALPALAPLARLLLRSESIASSKIEGMQVDARDLARAEAKLETGGKAGTNTREILANIDAMELAIDHATFAKTISVENIVEIHRILMASAPNHNVAGVIRTEQNWIGGNDYNPCDADFVPPPPEEVPRLLADLCEAINEDHLPPIVQAGLVHAQFETIHPFHDGNGRTGRALIHVVLRRRGMTPQYVPPISIVLASNKDGYIRGLSNFREGELNDWLTTFASAAAQSANLASAYLSEVERLQNDWRMELRAAANPRADAAAWKIIDALPAHPMITVAVAVAAIGRTKAAVSEAMAQLELAGVLIRESQGQRNRTWEARGLLNLLTDLESGVTPT
ncbi:MAG: Fic family protein [Candidatus Nanopelagicaceae bacterium]|nr:Fic family protein [Candidatus Nanopelagicaceae bacterium]